MAFVYALIVSSCLPQLLMEQFDILPSQCSHIKHICMKDFSLELNNFGQNDIYEKLDNFP